MEIIPAAGKDFLCKPFLLYCSRLLGITIRSKYVFGKGFGGRKGSNTLSIRTLLVNVACDGAMENPSVHPRFTFSLSSGGVANV